MPIQINELWNLVPADRQFNQHTKRDRLPNVQRLQAAEAHLAATYCTYGISPPLARAKRDDVATRFARGTDPHELANVVMSYIDQVATLRNIARF